MFGDISFVVHLLSALKVSGTLMEEMSFYFKLKFSVEKLKKLH